MSKPIYLVLTQSGTKISQAIRLFTRKPYNHASVSADLTLRDMYSFCRLNKYPLPAGFRHERIGEDVLGRFDVIPCEIYQIDLNDNQYRAFQETLDYFINHSDALEYNLIGLGAILVKKNLPRKSKYVCSQFVAYLLSESGVTLNKPIFLNTPDDLRFLPEARLIYTGELNRFAKSQLPPEVQ